MHFIDILSLVGRLEGPMDGSRDPAVPSSNYRLGAPNLIELSITLPIDPHKIYPFSIALSYSLALVL